MLLQWLVNKIPRVLVGFLLCLMLVTPSRADAWKWAGQGVSGVAEVKNFGKVRMTAVDQIAAGLGYKTEEKKEELLVVAPIGLRFVRGAAVVWLGYSVVGLPESARYEGGNWWVSADAALNIFSSFLKKNGRNITLQWAGIAQSKPPAPAPVPPPPQKKQEEKKVPPQKQEEKKITPAPNLPNLQGLRWGGTNDEVRAVLDLGSGKEPQYTLSSETMTVSVGSIPPDLLPKLKSNRQDVSLNVRNGSPAQLQFSFPGRSVRFFSLDAPNRFVIDFVKESHPALDPKAETKKSEPKSKQQESRGDGAKGSHRNKKKVVVIDAGHGGKDPGAMAHGYQEKTIALNIATKLASELKKQGVDVRMTRTGDTYPTLRERTAMANKWDADVFVSIHLNALPNGRHSKGIEIYIMALPTDKDAMELAKIENKEIAEEGTAKNGDSDARTEMLLSILGNMQQNVKISESTHLAEELFKSGQKSSLDMKRVAQAPFWVLRGAGMPSVLIETGFITELSEARQLARADYQQKMAHAFATGIMNFLKSGPDEKAF